MSRAPVELCRGVLSSGGASLQQCGREDGLCAVEVEVVPSGFCVSSPFVVVRR